MKNTYNNKSSVELALETIIAAQAANEMDADPVNVVIGRVCIGSFGAEPVRIFDAPAYVIGALVDKGFSVAIEDGSAVVEKRMSQETTVM